MKTLKNIAIFGTGGFGKEIACLINLINEASEEPEWNFIGFFDDDSSKWGKEVSHYGMCLGGMNELNSWANPLSVAIAIGNPDAIKATSERITNPNVEFPNLIAPTVTFLDRNAVTFGKGNIICSRCLVSCDITIGDFNIFNGYITLGHDAIIGNCNVFMPASKISGNVAIGNYNFMGLQSAILQKLKIGNNVKVGANSVIMRPTKDGYLYIGNSAKKTVL